MARGGHGLSQLGPFLSNLSFNLIPLIAGFLLGFLGKDALQLGGDLIALAHPYIGPHVAHQCTRQRWRVAPKTLSAAAVSPCGGQQ